MFFEGVGCPFSNFTQGKCLVFFFCTHVSVLKSRNVTVINEKDKILKNEINSSK